MAKSNSPENQNILVPMKKHVTLTQEQVKDQIKATWYFSENNNLNRADAIRKWQRCKNWI